MTTWRHLRNSPIHDICACVLYTICTTQPVVSVELADTHLTGGTSGSTVVVPANPSYIRGFPLINPYLHLRLFTCSHECRDTLTFSPDGEFARDQEQKLLHINILKLPDRGKDFQWRSFDCGTPGLTALSFAISRSPGMTSLWPVLWLDRFVDQCTCSSSPSCWYQKSCGKYMHGGDWGLTRECTGSLMASSVTKYISFWSNSRILSWLHVAVFNLIHLWQ